MWKGPDAPKEKEAGERSESDSRSEPQGPRELTQNRSQEGAGDPAGKKRAQGHTSTGQRARHARLEHRSRARPATRWESPCGALGCSRTILGKNVHSPG